MAAKTAKTGIYIDAQKLYNVIYAGQFEMDKRDRPLTALRLLDHTEKFLSSLNSSIGLMKHKQEFNNIMKLWNAISNDWKKYVKFDYDRGCIVARDKYKYSKLIDYKFWRI